MTKSPNDVSGDDLKEMRRRKDLLRNFDEIVEKLALEETVDLQTFIPDNNRRRKINDNIIKTLENKRKL